MRFIGARTGTAFLLAALAVACGRDGQRDHLVALTAIDSVRLAEDSLPLGMISGFAVSPSNEYFVSDRQHGAVLTYSSSGALRQVIGRRGAGPGEWAFGPFTILTTSGAAVVVSDGASLRALSSATGGVLWNRPQTPGNPILAATEDWVLTKRIDRGTRQTVARGDTSGRMESGGPFPQQLGRSQAVDQYLVSLAVAALPGDSLAVVTQGSDHLFIGAFAGPYDSIPLPVRRRRGAMQELLGAVNDSVPATMEAAAYKASYPLNVVLLAPGWIGVVMIDQTFLGDRMSGPLYLSVVDIRKGTACTDIPIPGPLDPHPHVAFRGDTMLILSQDVDSAAASSRTLVRRYHIGTFVCS